MLILSMVLIIVLSLSFVVLGDTGNHNDYSSGGSSDYDSSGDGLIDLIFWLIFSSLPLPIKLFIAAIIVIVYIKAKSGRKKNTTSQGNTRVVKSDSNLNVFVSDNTKEIELAIKKDDPNFSTGKFLGWSEEVFMTIQQAWTTRDWDKIRPFEKEELYRKHQLQLQEYINNGTINVVERINVNQTYLYRYDKDKEYEYLTVYLQARMNDYIIDENTKQVVRGDREREFHTKYLLTFMRKTGVKTNVAEGGMITHHCPHCGAPLEITSSGQCEYCGTIVTTGEHDWVLSDLDSIKKDTRLKRGGVFING